MPATASMRSLARPSRKLRSTGIPPATEPSKYSARLCSAAVAKISAPRSASTALLAVTTCLPERRAARMYSQAGSTPPTSSTTTSSSGSSISS